MMVAITVPHAKVMSLGRQHPLLGTPGFADAFANEFRTSILQWLEERGITVRDTAVKGMQQRRNTTDMLEAITQSKDFIVAIVDTDETSMVEIKLRWCDDHVEVAEFLPLKIEPTDATRSWPKPTLTITGIK